MKRILASLVLALAACALDRPEDGQLDVQVLDADDFHANGVEKRRVRITFEGSVNRGKTLTVTTSLGSINPAADAAGQRTLVLKTTAGEPIEFDLHAERTAGAGRVTVEGPDGAGDFADFELLAVQDVLDLSFVAGDFVADGQSSVTLTISLTSEDESFRDVRVKTSVGVLSPERQADAARERVVRAAPGSMTTLPLLLGATPGTAVVTAEVGNAFDVATFEVKAAASSLRLEADDTALANGQGLVPIRVSFDAPPARQATVTLTTSLGELNPAGASPEARRQTTLTLNGGNSAIANLAVGRFAGVAVIAASGPGLSGTFETVALDAALPDRLGLTLDSSVLDASRSQAAVSVVLARAPSTGSISTGTLVLFQACCENGAALHECTELLSVPEFTTDDNGDGREATSLMLTPTGRALVEAQGSSASDAVAATLHAFVLRSDPPPNAAAPMCAALASGTAVDELAAHDSVAVALRRRPAMTP